MKKHLFVMSLIFTFGFCQAQDHQDYLNNVVKINPFLFGRSEFQISYERYFNDRKSSIVLMPSYLLRDNGENNIEGWQMMGQYRIYLTHYRKDQKKTFLNVYNYGFYAGLYALYLDYEEQFTRNVYDPITFEYELNTYERSIQSYEGGALLGLQMDITKRIVLDFYVGGGLRKSEVEDSYLDFVEDQEYYSDYSVFDFAYTGVKPRVGLMLGITF